MSKTNSSVTRRLVNLLGSPAGFWVVVGLLVLQAAWIALSGRYPMAFDEDFHLGIIRLYAHHLSPFWTSQPAGADQFGAVARDPSYLYQYLMSFPYRLISLFTGDQTVQVLWLRALNVGLFAGALVLYRRLLLKARVSKAMVHACLLVFVLIPVVPFLAAQINYDNLFLPLTALSLLLTLRLDEGLVKRRRLDAKTFLQLLIVCLLTSLVKYAFLPIFLAIVGFLFVRVWQLRRSLRGHWFGIMLSWQQLSRVLRVGLGVSIVLAAGLFTERYGINMVRYHTPVPDCSRVLSVRQCSQYGPWIRDYDFKLNKLDTDAPKSSATFTADWFYGMWLRLFFAVDGPRADFQTRGPLLVPGLGAIIFAGAGVMAVLASLPKLLQKHSRPAVWLFVVMTACYVGVLWLDEYQAFLATGQPVAINGRYLLPVLPLAFLVVAIAARELVKWSTLKLVIASAAVLCLIWGGGALTYLLRSDDAWYWPNATVRSVNHAVQHTLGPITPGYKRPTQFLH